MYCCVKKPVVYLKRKIYFIAQLLRLFIHPIYFYFYKNAKTPKLFRISNTIQAKFSVKVPFMLF